MDAYSVILVQIALYVPLHTIMIMEYAHHVLELPTASIAFLHLNAFSAIVVFLSKMGYVKNKTLTLI